MKDEIVYSEKYKKPGPPERPMKYVSLKDSETIPVSVVCFHPVVAAKLLQGITHDPLTGEKYEPICCAIIEEKE